MPKAEYKKLSRRKVRYWCFRFKTEVGTKKTPPGNLAEGAPKGLRDYFERHPHFTGWEYFSETAGWDVDEKDPFKIIPLRIGSADAWNRELIKSAREFPMG